LTGQRVALFCCHGGGKGRVFNHLKAALPNSRVIGEIDFVEPLKHDVTREQERARTWAQGLARTT
jgi:hypothetical protein